MTNQLLLLHEVEKPIYFNVGGIHLLHLCRKYSSSSSWRVCDHLEPKITLSWGFLPFGDHSKQIPTNCCWGTLGGGGGSQGFNIGKCITLN